MYELDPQLFTMFPFYEDEWKRVIHNDYNGAFPEQPAHIWFLVFRFAHDSLKASILLKKIFFPIVLFSVDITLLSVIKIIKK